MSNHDSQNPQQEGDAAASASFAETTRKLKDKLSGAEPMEMNELEAFQALFAEYERAIQRSTQAHDALLHQVNKLKEEIELKNRLLARQERLAALGEMAAGVAHEIRNPLGGISLYLEMLASDVAGQEGPTQLCKKINVALKRLNHTVEMILGFTRPIEAKSRVLETRELLQEVDELASPTLREADVRVVPKIADDCVRLWGDQQLLVQLLLNLIRNAAQASPVGAQIDVVVVRDGDWLVLEVLDQGDGVPEEILAKLFTPFHTSKKGGTGLGLALCQRIAEAHRGEISGSNRDSAGARFVLRLPLVDQEA